MTSSHEFLDSRDALAMPWTESPFFERLLESSSEDPELRAMARRFHDDGFLVLENVFSDELIDGIVGHYDALFDTSRSYPRRPDKPSMLTHDPNRRQDAWVECAPVRELACHERVLEVLRYLYGRDPIPFQTLNFLPGTGQEIHSDSIHFDSLPNGYMCGVWVALEDVTEDNGPLLYYPGSHRLPRIKLDDFGAWSPSGTTAASPQYNRYAEYVRAVIEAHGFEEHRLTVPKGTALIWSSNLLHGGAAVRKPDSTRLSQVTHYYFENCAYYAPILSNESLGEYRAKEIFDIRTDERVPHRLNGEELQSIVVKDGRHRFGRPGRHTWTWVKQLARHDLGTRVEHLARARGWERLEKRARRFANKLHLGQDD